MQSVSFVVLTHFGRVYLPTCLPSVFAAIDYDGGDHEVIIVDNGSWDGTSNFVREHYPMAKLKRLEENQLYAEGVNAGIAEASREIVMVVDDDMIVEKDILRYLLDYFKDEKTFAVGAKLLLWDRRTIDGGKRGGRFIRGKFRPYGECFRQEDKGQLTEGPVLTVEGSAAYQKRYFLELGGLDPLFPLYYQFVDLTYRAWKRGYRIYFEPRSLIYHKHDGTASRIFSRSWIRTQTVKEHYLFTWKNITDRYLLLSHLLWMPYHLLGAVWQRQWHELRGFSSALREVRKIVRQRNKELPFIVKSDQELLIENRLE